jgi:hypothetical protein
MATFFAIFYIDDAYLASWDLEFFQGALDILVGLFSCTIICTPGRICIQLLKTSYQWMCEGLVTATPSSNKSLPSGG